MIVVNIQPILMTIPPFTHLFILFKSKCHHSIFWWNDRLLYDVWWPSSKI